MPFYDQETPQIQHRNGEKQLGKKGEVNPDYFSWKQMKNYTILCFNISTFNLQNPSRRRIQL